VNEFRRDKPPGRSWLRRFLLLRLRCPFHGKVLARNSVELHILPYGNVFQEKEENGT